MTKKPLKLSRKSPDCANLWDLFELIISEHGNDVALMDSETGESITYSDILSKAVSCSAFLSQAGIQKGDIVAFLSKNSTNYIWQLLGCLRIGAVCSLLSPSLKYKELGHLLRLYEPTIVIAPFLTDEQRRAIQRLKSQPILFTNDRGPWDHSKCFPLIDLLSIGTGLPTDPASVLANDAAFMLCSSGSTGMPKGVIISHQNMMTTLSYSEIFMRVKGPTLGLMPFCHAYGLGLVLMALYEKNPVIVMSNFSMDKLTETIRKHQLVNLHIVPSLLISLSKLPDSVAEHLVSVRFVMTGAGQISQDHQIALKRKLTPSAQLAHSYGMTETTFITLAGDFNKDKPSSPGRVLPGISIKIVDDNGVEVGRGKRGEILLRCPMVMKGYYKNDEATRAAFTDDGWLRSGDVAYVDDDGYYFIVDRQKELIKYQGHQISPTELETVIASVKGVDEVAVIGVPHELYGEVPRAVVVKAPGSNTTEDDVKKAICRDLASYKQLRGGVEFVSDLPKSPTGKILRGKLSRMMLSD